MATIPKRELDELAESAKLDTSTRPNGPEAAFREQGMARMQLLWRQRHFLWRAAGIGLLIATLVAFLIPKRYESSSLLMPPDDQSSSGMMMLATLSGKLPANLGAMAGDLLGAKTNGDLFIGILRSRTVEDEVITKFNLKKVYGKSDWQSTERVLGENTAISEDRKSGIITIKVTDRVPRRAAAMAGEYVSELNIVVSHLNTSSAHRERMFLEGRLAEVKQDLDTAEKDFGQFASKNATLDIKDQGKAMVEGAATLEGQMIAAQSELQGLKQIYSDNNVRVRSLTARVAELQSQRQKLTGKADTGTDASQASGDAYPSIRQLPLLGVTYADLYRRTKIQEAVFETLTQEYELAKVAEAKETPSVKVLDPPNVPERKSFPPRMLIMVFGVFLAFAFGVSWLLGKARWEEIQPQDPQKLFAQEVFHTISASMPWAPPNGSRFQAASHRLWTRVVAKEETHDRN